MSLAPRLLVNVQFLRFIAALMVVLFHTSLTYGTPPDWSGLVKTFGFSGVDVFFVISGFIMWHTNRDNHTAAGAGRFLYRRLARIYLGYWPIFALAVLSFWYFAPVRLQQYRLLESFLLLPQQGARPLQVSWTLTYELYFYLLFFAVLFVRGRLRLVAGIFLATLAANVWSAVSFGLFSPGSFQKLPFVVRFATAPWLLEFLGGCLVAALCERERRFGWVALALGVAVFAAAAALNATVFEMKLDHWFHREWRVALFGSGSVLVVYGLVALEHGGLRIVPKFSEPAGGASYAMYLCHPVLLSIATWTGAVRWLRGEEVSAVAFAAGFAALVTAISIAWYRWIEGPLYRGAKRLL